MFVTQSKPHARLAHDRFRPEGQTLMPLMPDPRGSGADDIVAFDTIAAKTNERGDPDRRPLIQPLRVMSDGRECTMTTLGDAVVFLTKHRPHRASREEWQRAVEAISAAQHEYSDRRRVLAMSLVRNICYIEGILRN